MTPPPRAAGSRRPRRAGLRFVGGAATSCGIIASALLIFGDDVQYVRVGLVATLWAAAAAAFAMAKRRREPGPERAAAGDVQAVYRLQPERESAARREHELGVAARLRKDLRLDTEEMAGLRAELAMLRKNLELWFGGELPPPRMFTDSTRIVELPGVDARNNGPRNGLPYPNALHGGYHEPPPPMFTGAAAANPAFASPYDAPVTVETSAALRAAQARGAELGPWPESEDQWETMPHHGWSDADWEVDEQIDDGLHSQGLSVAQIMANLRSEGGRLPVAQRTHHRD